jgi:ABC-2 type transport system permease protein
MKKIWLIIKREYLTRVRKKTFIISTILFPLLYLGLIFGSAYLGEKSTSTLRIALLDSSGLFDKGRIERENRKDNSVLFTLVTIPADSLKNQFAELGFDGYAIVPSDIWEQPFKMIDLNAGRTLSIQSIIPAQMKINAIWDGIKNEKLGLDTKTISTLEQSKLLLLPKNINDESASSDSASAIGYIAGILIDHAVIWFSGNDGCNGGKNKSHCGSNCFVGTAFSIDAGKNNWNWAGGIDTVSFMDIICPDYL